MRLNWTDNTPDEAGFIISLFNNVDTYVPHDTVGAGVQSDVETGLMPNQRYYWGISSYNANGKSRLSLVNSPTRANIPLRPLVLDSTFYSVKVALDGTDGNPSITEYAIQFNSQYVQANGSLGATAVWQTYAGWGGANGINIPGLTVQTTYPVAVKARNMDNLETQFGPSRNSSTSPRPTFLLNEDFTTYAGTAPPPTGWNEGKGDILNGGNFGLPTNSFWNVDGFANVTTTGAAKFNFWSGFAASDEWLVSPVLDLTLPGISSTLIFDIALNTFNATTPDVLSPSDSVFIVVSIDSGKTYPRSNVVATFTSSTPISGTRQTVRASLAPYSGVNKARIGFYTKHRVTSATDVDFFVDNVKVIRDFNNDLAAVSVDEPSLSGVKIQNVEFPVKASFTNTGLQTQTNASVTMTIIDSVSGAVSYTSEKSIPSIAPGNLAQVVFDNATISTPGIYLAKAIATLSGEEFPLNDTTVLSFRVVSESRTNLVADAGGYMYSASNSTVQPRPSYGWVEVGPSGNGTQVVTGDDAFSSVLTLPRPFTFYGTQYNSIKVCTNGWVGFDVSTTNSNIYQTLIPNNTVPNFLVAALWANLSSKSGVTGSGVYTKTVQNKYYIEWYRFQRQGAAGNSDTLNFEVVLDFADNSVAVSYASPSNGNFVWGSNIASVGIEGDGTTGNGMSFFYAGDLTLNNPTPGTTIKFGKTTNQLFHSGTVAGLRYLDANGNGIKDAGETGQGGWQINATGPVNSSAITDGNGLYEITALMPGSYTISETDSVAWQRTQPVSGSYSVAIGGSQVSLGNDFGGKHLISEIHGSKWDDLNGNSVRDNGEPGLENWHIVLTDAGGGGKTSSRVINEISNIHGQKSSIVSVASKMGNGNHLMTNLDAYTDAEGNYAFIEVPLGSFLISEEQQDGWLRTFPPNPGIQEVTISNYGQIVQGVDFGNFHVGSISGTKYRDANGNGTKDEGEAGLS